LSSGGLKSLTAPLGASWRCYVTLRRVLAFENDNVFNDAQDACVGKIEKDEEDQKGQQEVAAN
jgi:hypothetical protein